MFILESVHIMKYGNFDTKNVIDMYGTFCNCNSLKNLNLSIFNTQKVTDMSLMFNNCKSLLSLDLSNFNT